MRCYYSILDNRYFSHIFNPTSIPVNKSCTVEVSPEETLRDFEGVMSWKFLRVGG